MNMMTKMITGMIALVLLAALESTQADVLVDNDFDNGTSQDWTLTANASIYSGTNYAYSAPCAVDLLSGSGGAYVTLSEPLALASVGYTNVTWSFDVNNLATGYNKYHIEYSKDGGSNWISEATASVKYFYTDHYEYAYTASDLTDNFLFRVYIENNSPSQHTYIDNMVITAKPDVPPAGTVITIQ